LQVLPLFDNDYFLAFWTAGVSSGTDITWSAAGQKVPLPAPIASNPDALAFGNVLLGETKTGEKITVSLRNHLSPLSGEGVFSLAQAEDGIFNIVSVSAAPASAEPQVTEVTLSFTPSALQGYKDTLIVRSDYAEVYRIPLSGTGVDATGIDRVVETLHATSVQMAGKEGNIVVYGAAPGSRVSVYNLQGQVVKTQAVTSSEEILETAGLPRGVYIVAVRNDGQVILRQKVVL
jgi:hypothetical protein